MRIKIDVDLRPVNQIMERLGVDEQGKVQQHLTERVLFRMRRYMPWLSGVTASELTQVSSPTSITVNAPYAQYLYNGVSRKGNPLNYTRIENPLAGAHWDRTLMQNEGAAIAKEVEDYARSLS